ncbi:hypothetical protein FRC10_001236, partial [Ceratobasidium sp. 414]
MGRYNISMHPRRGAASLTSSLSTQPSLTPTSSTLPTPLPAHLEPATLNAPGPSAPIRKSQKVTIEEVPDESEERMAAKRACPIPGPSGTSHPTASNEASPSTPASKRQKVATEAPDESEECTAAQPPRPSIPSPSLPHTADKAPAHLDSDPGPSRPTCTTANRCNRAARRQLRRHKGVYVEDYPDPLAGSPVSNDRIPPPDLDAYMKSVGKLANPKVFEGAELLLTSGMTDATKERHIKSSYYEGHTPWCTCREMLTDVDKLAHGPSFELSDFEVFDGHRPRPQYMVSRDIIHVMRDIFANPKFKRAFRYKPVKVWTSAQRTERIYGDAFSTDWWWREQQKLADAGKRDATIVPLIISTDQTKLAVMCGGQKAYPVYVGFGNTAKDWRRKPNKKAMALLGYLPVDPFDDIENDDERRRLKADLVHRAMEKMLAPLRKASEEGVEMWCPDGRLRRVYPRVAAYTADWPEQNLQSCTSEGSCPICTTSFAGRGDPNEQAEEREREETLSALRKYFAQKNIADLRALHLKPVWPWWGDLPDVNLATCFTPDLLHQVYQGMFKTHLLRWLKFLVGPKVLDERLISMKLAAGMRQFTNGISGISQWTGRESKQLLAQILPVVIGDLRPGVARMVRSLVDFMFRAHASSMTESDLVAMENDLATFHELKDMLVVEGVYESAARFDHIPKLHMLQHYVRTIRELGTPDGYNTETPEHLHIEYAKTPWRASNKVKPLPQMVKYIQRQEAIRVHKAYLDQYLGLDKGEGEDIDEGDEPEVFEADVVDIGPYIGEEVEDEDEDEGCDAEAPRGEDGVQPGEGVEGDDENEPNAGLDAIAYPEPRRQMAKHPTKHNVPLRDVIDHYGASNIITDITRFLGHRLGVPPHDVLVSRHNHVDVWHKLYLHHRPPHFAPFDSSRRDTLRASAPQLNATTGRTRKPGVWDVALYLEKPNRLRSGANQDEKHGIERYRAGRVRTFFTLPAHLKYLHPGPLAYVEVFTVFDASAPSTSGLHSTRPDFDSHNRRRTLVIPVTDISLTCHLTPKFHLLDKELKLTAATD